MNTLPRITLAASALLGTAATAQAGDILAGGTIFGGHAQARAVCYFYNAGTTPLTLTNVRIADQAGNPAPLVNLCQPSLAPGKACPIEAAIAKTTPYSCQAVVSPDKQNARGVLEVRDAKDSVLQNVELR